MIPENREISMRMKVGGVYKVKEHIRMNGIQENIFLIFS